MIRAIIFDCFGVLTTDGWLPFKQQHFGHDRNLGQEATDLNTQVDAGRIHYKDYLQQLADLAGVSFQKVHAALEGNVANDELFEYISNNLKPKYKIGLLSNAAKNWLDQLFGPEPSKLFDAVALSYETGVTKPDVAAYSVIATRLGVEPDECIFVDAQERYCAGARAAGMQAIVYRDFEQFKGDIEPMLSKS